MGESDAAVTRAIVRMQLLGVVPPFLRERLIHDCLKDLGYKLSEEDLVSLRNWVNPRITQGMSSEAFKFGG